MIPRPAGLTLVGRFGVLAFSPMPCCDFGTVVALDVLFALASTLILLPPLLVSTTGAMSTAAGPQKG